MRSPIPLIQGNLALELWKRKIYGHKTAGLYTMSDVLAGFDETIISAGREISQYEQMIEQEVTSTIT